MLSAETITDLQHSGLSLSTIEALQITQITQNSYKIPYFDFNQNPLIDDNTETHFQRTKHLNSSPKYTQPPNTQTHLYIPPLIAPHYWFDSSLPLVITEGEKKAAKACQEGILCVALGGVQNWHRKTLTLPRQTVSAISDKSLTLELTPHQITQLENPIVPELLQLMPFNHRQIILAFDTDPNSNSTNSNTHQTTNHAVQRAAFELSLWLKEQGANPSQVILPNPANSNKIGLDDFLILNHPEGFQKFWSLPQLPPSYPDPLPAIQKLLNKNPKTLNSRSTHIKIAHIVVNNLDNRGQRYVDDCKHYYYYDQPTSTLHEVPLNSNPETRNTSFATLLKEEFGIPSSDSSLLSRIYDEFCDRRLLKEVTPHRVSYASGSPPHPNALYYQLSNSHLAKVTSEYISIEPNGYDNVLFLADQVKPIPLSSLQPIESHLLNNGPAESCFLAPLHPEGSEPRWIKTLKQTSLQPFPNLSLQESQILLAALFYLNPWFRRWRGLMLPIELAIAEPGSGKSMIYSLRNSILTGQASLQNPPTSQRDWYSQITNFGGLWVCDNLGEPPHDLKTLMSDELSRLVTDPSPHVSMRELYTTAGIETFPVDPTFAVTAIKNPFHKPDLLQRSLVIPFAAIPYGQRDSQWWSRNLNHDGGRTGWVLEQLYLSQRFLQQAERTWDDNYLSDSRLVHFEQSLLCMGRAMGPYYGDIMTSLLPKLRGVGEQQISQNDPVIEALTAFCEEAQSHDKTEHLYTVTEICRWAASDPDNQWGHVRSLEHPVWLGRYIKQHEHDIREIAGLQIISYPTRTVYKVVKRGL